MMSDNQRKRLFDMHIDEVSLVDRAANQHAVITFAKDGGDVEYLELGEDDLILDSDEYEVGETLVAEDGTEYEVVGYVEEVDEDGDEQAPEQLELPYDEADYITAYSPDSYLKADRQAEGVAGGVHKAGPGIGQVFNAGRRQARLMKPLEAGAKGPQLPGTYKDPAVEALSQPKKWVHSAGQSYERNPLAYKIGAGGAAGLGGYALTRKSDGGEMNYGEYVLEELSKAVNDSDREQVIAKVASEVEQARHDAYEAMEFAQSVEDAQIEAAFISKSAEYNLPVHPNDFGPILHKIALALTEDEFELVDKMLSVVGDALYDEIGYVGGNADAQVLDVVENATNELLANSDGSFSKADAMVAMFESNPEAYDAYLHEQR